MAHLSPRQSLKRRIAYLSEHAAPSERTMIVDVGANPVHTPPYHALMKAQACTVLGFEPQEEAYEALIRDAAENERYVKAALGKPGKGTLHLYATDGFASLYPLSEPSLDYLGKFRRQVRLAKGAVPVTLTSLDKLDEVPQIDCLKIDVQGAEYDIIEHGAKKLSRAVAVIPELRFYRLYEDEPLMGDLDVLLRSQGFVLHKFLPIKQIPLTNSQTKRLRRDAMRSQLIDGDAVYIRDMEKPGDWTSDQLRHLALLAGCVFDSQDLCLRCLDLLVERGELTRRVPKRYADLLPAWYHEGAGEAESRDTDTEVASE